jgi:hypothetical protein
MWVADACDFAVTNGLTVRKITVAVAGQVLYVLKLSCSHL